MNPILTIYHPNARCTGAVIKFELISGDCYGNGHLLMTLANQVLPTTKAENVFPRFDWANDVCVKLDMAETAKIVGVLRGNAESINDGLGIVAYSKDGRATTFRLRHIIDPESAYSFEIVRRDAKETESTHRILLRAEDEGLALLIALESAISKMAWG